MATMLEVGQQIVRGERETFPLARLVGLVFKELEPGRAVFERAGHAGSLLTGKLT